MNLQWSIAKRFRYCVIVLNCNAWSNYLSDFDRHVARLMFIDINMDILQILEMENNFLLVDHYFKLL